MAEENNAPKAKKTKSPLVGTQAKPTVLDKTTKLDIDTNKVLIDNIIGAGLSGGLKTDSLENFTAVSNSRDQIYQLIDTMMADSSVASIIRTYTEDVCEPNDKGHIVWCESDNPKVSMFVNYLLNVMNVDKNIVSWTSCLLKYGDVYLRLFRDSDYDDPIFKKDNIRNVDGSRSTLNESIETLDENINLNIHTSGDQYSYYVEMVNDPGSMFELTKYGKTYGYIEVPVEDTNTNLFQNYLGSQGQQINNYRMRSNDINIYQADDFVHASLDDNVERYPEKVELFTTEDDLKNNTNAHSYTVRRGKSLLYDSYKIWREKSLLENAALLNRITRSSVVRNIQVEVGDMGKTQVKNTLRMVKELFEQKSAIQTGTNAGMNEYNSPGPIENNIFTATHNGQGALTINSVGGDVDVKSLADLDYWNNKYYSSYGIPKQYFGWCLGKDTEILLLDGTTHTIEELYNNKNNYIGKGIMGCNTDGSLCPTKITNIMLTSNQADLIRVWLDNNKFVDVTPDHKMMLRNGNFIRADELAEGDSLMPYYDRIKDGRRQVLDNKNGKFISQHHIVAAKAGMPVESGYNIHHKNKNKLDDDFDNLIKLSVDAHCKEHNFDLAAMHKIANEKHRQNGKANVANMQTARMNKMADEKPEVIRKLRKLRCPVCDKIFEKSLNDIEYSKYLHLNQLHFCCPGHRNALDAGGKLARSYQLLIKSNYDKNTYETNRIHGNERPDTFLKFDTLASKLDILNAYIPEVNHMVTKIEKLSANNTVYDLTVADECHTFALPCGIFVHNCDDGAGFNGGTSLTVLSSVYAKGVKKVQNAILQAITDAINLFLVNRGLRSYLNNFVLKMKAPLTQEEKDYRAALTDRINSISSFQALFTDIEDKASRLTILKNMVSTLNYGDEILQVIDKEIEAAKIAKKKEEEEAAAAAEAEANLEATEEANEPETPEAGADEDIDLGMASVATEESFIKNPDGTILVEGPDYASQSDDNLPTPEELDETKDFTKNN